MLTNLARQFCVSSVVFCLMALPLMQSASGAIISTETAIDLTERLAQVDRINEVLARDTVQSALIRLGVDPVNAMARVDALTDAELLTLENRLDDLPAGGTGIVEAVGIVAIVLIVLELLHVTEFFSEF